MKNQGKILVIGLGAIVVAFVVAFAALTIATRPPGLSQEKMQKKVEAAEKGGKDDEEQSGETQEDEESIYTKSIKAFQVTAGTGQSADASEGQEEENGEDVQEESDAEGDSGYLCSYSSDRLMTEADVQELKQGSYADLPEGKGIIRMVVNELYAKHGYQFGKEEIQAYFDQKEWYKNIPTRSAEMNEIIKKMTDTERANVEFLSPYIEEE